MAFKLKLLRGGHDNEFCETRKGYEAGEVFFSRTNLAEKEPNRFAFVGEVNDSKLPPTKAQRAKLNGDAKPAENTPIDELDGMTVSQLKGVAADEEIEIDATFRRAEIIEAIRQHRELVHA